MFSWIWAQWRARIKESSAHCKAGNLTPPVVCRFCLDFEYEGEEKEEGENLHDSGTRQASNLVGQVGEEEAESEGCGKCENAGQLIAPCDCKGTVKWVHRGCLHKWLNATKSSSRFWTCDTCNSKFEEEESEWRWKMYKLFKYLKVTVLTTVYILHVVAAFVFVKALIIFSGLVGKVCTCLVVLINALLESVIRSRDFDIINASAILGSSFLSLSFWNDVVTIIPADVLTFLPSATLELHLLLLLFAFCTTAVVLDRYRPSWYWAPFIFLLDLCIAKLLAYFPAFLFTDVKIIVTIHSLPWMVLWLSKYWLHWDLYKVLSGILIGVVCVHLYDPKLFFKDWSLTFNEWLSLFISVAPDYQAQILNFYCAMCSAALSQGLLLSIIEPNWLDGTWDKLCKEACPKDLPATKAKEVYVKTEKTW